MKIDVGCGENIREGYVGCDIRDMPGVDIVCAAWELHDHVDGVESINSRHSLEHLTYDEALKALVSWHDVLAPGGTIDIVVPNLLFHMGQMLIAKFDEDEMLNTKSSSRWGMAGLYGWQRHEHDIHKSGYTPSLLSYMLREAGFVDVSVSIVNNVHLKAEGRKSNEVLITLQED